MIHKSVFEVRSLHNRQSIRLPGFDYAQPGHYFVTLVTAGRATRFGDIVNGVIQLSPVGEMAHREWLRLADRFPGLELCEYAFMPNHLHGILSLAVAENTGESKSTAGESGSLGAVIRAYKAATTYRFRQFIKSNSCSLWQRNYYEHIIRGSKDFDLIRAYILQNPIRWEEDRENPARRI